MMSPKITVKVDSVAYDAKTLTLYVSLHQILQFWFLPDFPSLGIISAATAYLVTVLHLIKVPTQELPALTICTSTDTPSSHPEPATSTSHETPLHVVPEERKEGGDGGDRYLIMVQNDLFQVDQFIRLVSPYGVLALFVYIFQLISTALCVLGVMVFENFAQEEQKGLTKKVAL